MNIYIDIERVIGANGKACLYYPHVHWQLDDEDTVDKIRMDSIKDILQHVLEQNLCERTAKVKIRIGDN